MLVHPSRNVSAWIMHIKYNTRAWVYIILLCALLWSSLYTHKVTTLPLLCMHRGLIIIVTQQSADQACCDCKSRNRFFFTLLLLPESKSMSLLSCAHLPGRQVSWVILGKQLKLEGFIVYRWYDQWPPAFKEMAQWIQEVNTTLFSTHTHTHKTKQNKQCRTTTTWSRPPSP